MEGRIYPSPPNVPFVELLEEMRREVERVTGIANLPPERKRSTINQMRLEWWHKYQAKR